MSGRRKRRTSFLTEPSSHTPARSLRGLDQRDIRRRGALYAGRLCSPSPERSGSPTVLGNHLLSLPGKLIAYGSMSHTSASRGLGRCYLWRFRGSDEEKTLAVALHPRVVSPLAGRL